MIIYILFRQKHKEQDTNKAPDETQKECLCCFTKFPIASEEIYFPACTRCFHNEICINCLASQATLKNEWGWITFGLSRTHIVKCLTCNCYIDVMSGMATANLGHVNNVRVTRQGGNNNH